MSENEYWDVIGDNGNLGHTLSAQEIADFSRVAVGPPGLLDLDNGILWQRTAKPKSYTART